MEWAICGRRDAENGELNKGSKDSVLLHSENFDLITKLSLILAFDPLQTLFRSHSGRHLSTHRTISLGVDHLNTDFVCKIGSIPKRATHPKFGRHIFRENVLFREIGR